MYNSSKEVDNSYKRDRDNFLEKLQEFHDARGSSIGKVPTFGGQPLDLYALYNTVTSFGGISVVTDRKKWGQVFRALGFPPCTNAEYALRQHYSRYLEAFEKIFFFGEDADDLHDTNFNRTHSQLLKYRRLNRAPRIGSLGEPLVGNFNRISYSLQCGLENEVNFALNICSLLSNVSNSIFNLAKSPQILDLMLSHVGIWSNNDGFTKILHDQWRTDAEKNFEKFWLTSIDTQVAKNIFYTYYSEENCVNDVKDNAEVFGCKETKFGIDSPECSRAIQICTVLYNFSFEPINAMYLATHEDAVRFLILCSCCIYSSLRRTSLDALDNISEHIRLYGIEHSFTQSFFQILHSFLQSKDKFRNVRGLSVLGKLASKEENHSVLTEVLYTDTYHFLIQTLYLPDISLLLTALDALYNISGINDITANAIARVHGSISILVCLVTVRAESFGNRAIQGFRIVENKHSIFTPKNQSWLRSQQERRQQMLHPPMVMSPTQSGRSYPHVSQQTVQPPPLPPHPAPYQHPSFQQLKSAEPLVELDAEIFAAHWMSGFYEPHPSNQIAIQKIYEDYVNTCKECKRNGILSVSSFTDLLRTILPPHLAKIGPLSEGSLGITGILRRNPPTQIRSKIPKSLHEQLLKNKQMVTAMQKQQQQQQHSETVKNNINKPEVLDDNSNLSLPESIQSKDSDAEKHDTGVKSYPERKGLNGPCSNDQVQKLESLEGLKLDTVVECQGVIERLKGEIHNHFMQFHAHRQQIQMIQVQIQQLMRQSNVENFPADAIKNIQSRVQIHHQQMAVHYQRLQQLNVLSERIQSKMKEMSQNSSLNSPTVQCLSPQITGANTALNNTNQQNFINARSSLSLNQTQPTHILETGSPGMNSSFLPNQQNVQPGQSFIVPPAVPFVPTDGSVAIQHSIPTNMVHSPSFGGLQLTAHYGQTNKPGRGRSGSPRGRNGRGARARGKNQSSKGSPKAKDSRHNVLTNGYTDVPALGNVVGFPPVPPTPFQTTFSPQANRMSSLMGVLPAQGNVSPSFHQPPAAVAALNQNSTLDTRQDRLPQNVNIPNTTATTVTSNPMDKLKRSDLPSPISQGRDPHALTFSSDASQPKRNHAIMNGTNGDDSSTLTGNSSDSIVKTGNSTDSIAKRLHCREPHEMNGNNHMNDDEEALKNPAKKSKVTEEEKERHSLLNGTTVHDPTVLNGGDSGTAVRDKVENSNKINGIADDESIDIDLNLSRNKKHENGEITRDTHVNGLVDFRMCNGHMDEKPELAKYKISKYLNNDKKSTKFHTEGNGSKISTGDSERELNEDIKDVLHALVNEVSQSIESRKLSVVENSSKSNQPHKMADALKLDLTTSNNDFLPSNLSNSIPVEGEKSTRVDISTTQAGKNFSNLTTVRQQLFYCEWESCLLPPFQEISQLLTHMIQSHAPLQGQMSTCNVAGCPKTRQSRGAMISHFQEKHCLLQKEDGNFTTIPMPDARLLASHSGVQHEDESPVTRSVRYTAALILRNLARNSCYARGLLSVHELKLAAVAMSTSEAASAITECLKELSRDSDIEQLESEDTTSV